MISKHRLFAAGAVLLALSLLASLPPAFADVTLVYFTAEARADNTILVKWQTATELGTTGFRLYRSDSASPATWGDPITSPFPAQGTGPTGADYQYVDANATVGVKYYYLLEELTSNGTAPKYGPVAAGIGVATDTPTASPTASATLASSATATWTPRPTITPYPSATQPPPTATRRYTETPVVFQPSATPTRAGGTASPLRTPSRTPLPGAHLATPTGLAPRVTPAPPAPPTATTLISPLEPPTPSAPASATAEVIAAQPTEELETATPRPIREVTPVIFAAETTSGGRATPQATEETVAQGARSTSLALILGGSAIGVAGLLAAVLLFLRSRRS